jgi:hypothetical protein
LSFSAIVATATLSGSVCKARTPASPNDVYEQSFEAEPAHFLERLHDLEALPQQDEKTHCVEAYLLSGLKRLPAGQWRACLGVATTISSAPRYLKQVCASEADAEKCRVALEPDGYRATRVVLTPDVNVVALPEASEGGANLLTIFDRKLENAAQIVVNAPKTECELAVYTSYASVTVNRCSASTPEQGGEALLLAGVLPTKPPEPKPDVNTGQQGNQQADQQGSQRAADVPPQTKAKPESPTLRISSYVTAGLAAACFVASGAFTAHAVSKYHDSEQAGHCTSQGCDDQGYALRTDAFSSAHAATGFVVAGAVLAGASVTLFVLDRRQRAHVEGAYNGNALTLGVRGEL